MARAEINLSTFDTVPIAISAEQRDQLAVIGESLITLDIGDVCVMHFPLFYSLFVSLKPFICVNEGFHICLYVKRNTCRKN